MILRERLQSLGYQARGTRPAAERDLEGIARVLGAEVRENAHGPVLVLEDLVRTPLGRLPDAREARLLGLRPEGGTLLRPCFFDTETTGVSGGAGTQAFLCALAWPAPGGLLLRQYLLADPSLERAMLEEVRADLLDGDGLVTYNGRSFDCPLLEGRLLMARMAPLPRSLPHLDLLQPARRIFRARLGGCTLGGVESAVLGRDRGPDIPGFLIPETYFAYLRSGDPEPLREVLAHNRQDVVSLSLLLDHLCGLLGDGLAAAHPLDRFGVARLLDAAGAGEPALALYAGLWAESDCWAGEVWPGPWSPVELAYVTGLRLAVALRRAGRRESAVPILEALWRRHPRPLEAGIMLAKHLEHHRRDRPAALQLVGAALDAVEARPSRDRREERFFDDLVRRRARLARLVGP